MASTAGRQYRYGDAFTEAGGWFGALQAVFDGSWSLMFRWQRPHMYRESGYAYESRERFPTVDGLERVKYGNVEPFECTINPDSGKFERLLVQAPKDICSAANSTWRRTVVRNSSPMFLRVANLPYKLIHRSRRSNASNFTALDWCSVILMWPVAVAAFFLYIFAHILFRPKQPQGKVIDKYLPFLYKGYKYPLLAKNLLENRDHSRLDRLYDSAWLSGGPYRPLRPRYLCFLKGASDYEIRPVKADDDVPYVFIAYTSEHFDCAPSKNKTGSPDLTMLVTLAIKATQKYKKTAEARGERAPVAFWLAHQCTPQDRYVGDDGEEVEITDQNKHLVQKLNNQDTYSISDIIRMAERVIVIAGNPSRADPDVPRAKADQEALRQWGSRAWTLPEILLSKGHSVDVCFAAQTPLRQSSISKDFFPSMAWTDSTISRQLVDHFATLHLSRLELVDVAWECLMKRDEGMHRKFAGDMSYILMGLLRLRPPVDTTDTPFQAFGRLSLPQDSDRLTERLILLLPELQEPLFRQTGNALPMKEDQRWEKMTDQYKAKLWDIYPDTQVCGIGDSDTIVVDGFKGALIQWSSFSPVRTQTKFTLKRRIALALLKYSLPILLVGILLLIFPFTAPIGIFVILVAVLFPSLAPILVPWLYQGKLWGIEPCLFGIEGFVPIEEIERRIFGAGLNRLKWSANFSPLSRHGPGAAGKERCQEYYDDEGLLLRNPVDGWVETCLVEGKSPFVCGSCEKQEGNACPTGTHKTYHEIRRQTHGALGEMKIFTLVDTLSMTVTVFEARRPPVALLVGGSEGGMKRALACSYDMATGVLYRETVLRIPSTAIDCMHAMPRVRLGLQRRFHDIVPRGAASGSGIQCSTAAVNMTVTTPPPEAQKAHQFEPTILPAPPAPRDSESSPGQAEWSPLGHEKPSAAARYDAAASAPSTAHYYTENTQTPRLTPSPKCRSTPPTAMEASPSVAWPLSGIEMQSRPAR